MHPLTCYAGQISLCHAKIEKISKKIFVMVNKDGGDDNFWILWGGQFLDFLGGDNFWILWGDTAVIRGDIELMGGSPSPPTRENPVPPKSFSCKKLKAISNTDHI